GRCAIGYVRALNCVALAARWRPRIGLVDSRRRRWSAVNDVQSATRSNTFLTRSGSADLSRLLARGVSLSRIGRHNEALTIWVAPQLDPIGSLMSNEELRDGIHSNGHVILC